MLPNIPTLGVRFDIGKIDSAAYGFECWKVVWRAVDIRTLAGALLFEGDTAATLSGRENVYCIAIQSIDESALNAARSGLEKSEEFNGVAASPPFVVGMQVLGEPLVNAGRVDVNGNLVGESFWARPALGALRREMRKEPMEAHIEEPMPERKRPASPRTTNLPPLSSVEELLQFLLKNFSPAPDHKYNYWFWLTPEELCDIVEDYSDLVQAQWYEGPSALSEDMLCVHLLNKKRIGGETIYLIGLFPFATESEARAFCYNKSVNPEHLFGQLEGLWGIEGRFALNFQGESGFGRIHKEDYERTERNIAAEELWAYICKRRTELGVSPPMEEQIEGPTQEEMEGGNVGMLTYQQAMRQEARRLIAEHGELVEVRCVSGPPDYRIELAFADGYEEIITKHSGRIDITMMKFGYMGTGTRCFWAFLDEASFKDVSLEQLAEMEGPQVLRKGEPLKGIDLLVELCTRDDILSPDSLLKPAVEDLKQHGERGARALAILLTELLQCRADKIGYAIAAAKEVSPVPELLSALESIASAPPLTSPPADARFRPEIAGIGQIGWTDGTAERIRRAASDALKVLSEGEEPEEAMVEEEPRAAGPAEVPGGEAELSLWADVSRDPSLVNPLILEKLQKSMCFMVRDETGPVAALIIRASPDEFRSPLTAETPMSLYVHYYRAPTFDLYGVYPIVWDDPQEPFFKETWLVGADRVTGPPDPLSQSELSRLEALLSQEYTYFLIVDPSNRLVAAQRVDYSPETQEHFLGFLPKVSAARGVTISNVELISALQEYLNCVSLEEVKAAARRLGVAEAEPKEKGIICANCKSTFQWDDAYNLQDTPGSYNYNPPGHGDFRPRAFCPHCGFLVAEWDIDRYADRNQWKWHGANAELNQDQPLPPGPLTWWGKSVPLQAKPITEEEFVDLSKVSALQRKREDRRARKEKEVAPDDLEGYLERGFLHLEDNELDEAIADFQHCLELRADYAPAHRGLGWAYYLNRYSGDPKANMDKALSHLREAMRLDPKDGEPHYFLGIIHHNEGEEEEAITEYLKALELGLPPGKEAGARSSLGQKCIDRGQLAEAVAHFEKAKELDPLLFAPHTYLQIIYEAWGERAKAEVERREAERTCGGTSLVPSVEAKGRELASRGRPIPTAPLIRLEAKKERIYPWRGRSKLSRVAMALGAIVWFSLCAVAGGELLAMEAMSGVAPTLGGRLAILFWVVVIPAACMFEALRPTTMRELVISPEKELIFRRKSGKEKPVIAQIDRVAETQRGKVILIQGRSSEGKKVRAQIAKGNLAEGEFERFKDDLHGLIPGVKIAPTRALPVRKIFAGITAVLGVLALGGFLFTAGATIHDYVKGLVSAQIPLQTQVAIVLGLLAAFLLFAGLSILLSERRKIGALFWSGLLVVGLLGGGYILAYVWEGGLLREALPSVPPTATPVPRFVTFEGDRFSFEYPSNWEVITEKEVDILLDTSLKGLSPSGYDYIGGVYTGGVDGCRGCAHIVVMLLKDPNLTGTLTDEQYEQVKSSYETSMGPRLISIERTEVSGMPGIEVVNIGRSKDTKLRGVIIVPPEPGMAYSLNCLSHKDSFDEFEAIFSRATESLRIGEVTPRIITPSPVAEVITYTVQAGDTLGEIAAEFGVTVEAIVEANDIEDPSLVNVGQVLVIPKSQE